MRNVHQPSSLWHNIQITSLPLKYHSSFELRIIRSCVCVCVRIECATRWLWWWWRWWSRVRSWVLTAAGGLAAWFGTMFWHVWMCTCVSVYVCAARSNAAISWTQKSVKTHSSCLSPCLCLKKQFESAWKVILYVVLFSSILLSEDWDRWGGIMSCNSPSASGTDDRAGISLP